MLVTLSQGDTGDRSDPPLFSLRSPSLGEKKPGPPAGAAATAAMSVSARGPREIKIYRFKDSVLIPFVTNDITLRFHDVFVH